MVDHPYALQWWTDDSRPIGAGRATKATDEFGNSVTLQQNVIGQDGGLGQFAVGTFIATSNSLVITFTKGGSVGGYVLNGYQLRDMIPEPSVVGLLALGGVLLRRRGKQ